VEGPEVLTGRGGAARALRRGILACAAAVLAAACGSSTGTPTGPDLAWKGGRVRVYDYGDPTIRSDFKVEWGGGSGPRRILCETGFFRPTIEVGPDGRLVVRHEKQLGMETWKTALTFRAPDEPPEERTDVR
jgi:hypothetical protein